jgi:hypothetical protein
MMSPHSSSHRNSSSNSSITVDNNSISPSAKDINELCLIQLLHSLRVGNIVLIL